MSLMIIGYFISQIMLCKLSPGFFLRILICLFTNCYPYSNFRLYSIGLGVVIIWKMTRVIFKDKNEFLWRFTKKIKITIVQLSSKHLIWIKRNGLVHCIFKRQNEGFCQFIIFIRVTTLLTKYPVFEVVIFCYNQQFNGIKIHR